jgi:anti-anti-sigma regulatory factor
MKEKALTSGWSADVDRGPDWLMVRLHAPATRAGDGAGLADDLWSLLRGHLVRRMVLELDEIDRLRSGLVGQLVTLQDRVSNDGGVLRVCGLSDENCKVLRTCRLDARFPNYHDRREAIMAPRRISASVPESPQCCEERPEEATRMFG